MGVGPDADLFLPHFVWGAVLAHLADGNFARAVGVDLIVLRACRFDRRLVHEQRMSRVAQVFEIQFPVAVEGMPEDAPATSISPSGARSTMSSSDVVI